MRDRTTDKEMPAPPPSPAASSRASPRIMISDATKGPTAATMHTLMAELGSPTSSSPTRKHPLSSNASSSDPNSNNAPRPRHSEPATSRTSRRTRSYNNEFTKRDSVENIRREVDAIQTTSSFFHRDFDREVHVFQEEPHIRVLGGRSEDAWPTRYVEYDLEMRYKNFTWRIELPKSAIYGLWFYVKSKMHSIGHRNHSLAQISHGSGSSHASSSFPQLRKLFLANAEKSTSPEMIALIQQYLEGVIRIPNLLSSAYVVSMFQVSNSTFDDEEGYTSVREGWLRVRMWLKGNQENVRVNRGAITCDNECFNCMCVIKRVNLKSKKWRWVALKHSCIAVYASIQETKASEVFLFDQNFNIERGIQSAGSNNALLVSNSTFVMQLEAKTKQSIIKWANDIRKAAEKSDWSQSHRDDSYSIPRSPALVPSHARWLVDGNDAYEAIYDAIQGAKKEIYIAGWWICPMIHLLRPAALYPQSRLDQVLLKKAEEGLDIYILMYKEVSVALTLNSNYSKLTFRRLHPRINVLRDPDFLMKHLGMWSHHEKIVSVDQKISFVGGLDLCFGRWDTPEHDLFDKPNQLTMFVGKDYSNPRVKDFVDVHLPEKDLIDRDRVPRMPWHDCHCRLEGQPARDVARHFIQRWNYSVSTRSKKEKLYHLVPRTDYPRHQPPSRDNSSRLMNQRLRKAVQTVRAVHGLRKTTLASMRESDDGTEPEVSPSNSNHNRSPTKPTTSSPTKQRQQQQQQPSEEGPAPVYDKRSEFQRTKSLPLTRNGLLPPMDPPPRSPAESDARTSPKPVKPDTDDPSSPSSASAHDHARGFDHDRHLSRVFSRPESPKEGDKKNETVMDDEPPANDGSEAGDSAGQASDASKRGYPAACQILRSISFWSGGCPTERSIQNAYLRLIGSAQHFVYIENQFFVSGLDGDPLCSNRIANALVERIRRAAANQEKFRVMVIMPLMPAFPGKPEDKESSSLRGVMHWQYRSICRGEYSIYHTLFKELDDPFEYIAFYGLRTHCVKGVQPRTEEVYVHSKVMIVDDRACIIGSANVNERSMAGDRDSEIAVLVEDTELDERIKIANGNYPVGKFAHSFRMKLFEEHFGVEPGSSLYEKYQDPVNSDAWFSMQDQAMKNCQIYESVFGCLPSDSILTFKQISAHMETGTSLRDSISQAARSTFINKNRSRAESSGGGNNGNNNNANNGSSSPTASASPSARASPAKKYHKPKIVASPLPDDEIVNDGQIRPELFSSMSDVNTASPTANATLSMNRRSSRETSALFGAMTVNMREDSQIQKRKEELKEIQGHIVYFPLKFLSEEVLEPKLFPAELFQ